MDYDQLFLYCNQFAFFTWLLLIIAPYWSWTPKLVLGISVTLLCALYAFFIFQSFGSMDFNDFGTLEGVKSLFTSKEAVLVGWIHYLAFDLMVGYFIVINAFKNGINRFLLIPCLLFTFMMGPVGLLMYLVLRFVYVRSYFVSRAY